MKTGDLIKVKCPSKMNKWYHGVILELNYGRLPWQFDEMWCAETRSLYIFDMTKDEIKVLCEAW